MAANTGAAGKKEVAESCFDLLHHSMVENFCGANRAHPDKDLEGIGFTVGQKLTEKYVKDRSLFSDELEVITFLCKDFWTEVYGKQMDKLRTNHKGVFELQDHRFRAVLRVSTGPDGNALEAAKRYLVFPCGVIRGALASLGIIGSDDNVPDAAWTSSHIRTAQLAPSPTGKAI